MTAGARDESPEELRRELEQLRCRYQQLQVRLDEAESTVEAISRGEVDAFVVTRGEESRVFPLDTAQLWHIADAVPALISYVTPDLRFRFVNRLYETWFNKPRHEITGSYVSDLIGEASYSTFRPYHERCLAGEEVTCEAWLDLPIGKRFIRVRYTPDIDPQGKVNGFVALILDLTEQRAAAEQRERLLQQEREFSRRMRRLAEFSVQIAAARDVDSALAMVAEEARLLIGTHRAVARLSGRKGLANSTDVVSLSAEHHHLSAAEVLAAGKEVDAEICRHNKPQRQQQDGSEPGASNLLAAPLVSRGGKNLGLVRLSHKCAGDFTPEDEAILVQLTQMASRIIENARLYQELRKKDRRKDEFLAMLGHELRNPLAALSSSLMVVELPTSDDEDRDYAVEVMGRQTAQLKRLIDDLLDVSRITTGKIRLQLQRLDLAELLRRAAEAEEARIEAARHTFELQLGDEPMWVNGDAPRLEQVFVNLLSNACKYTPPGGHIRLLAERTGEEVAVRVRDTGMGIDPEMLDQVFELFSQASQSLDRSHGGLGIGLTVVRTLVEMHHGTITADSQGAGHGSEFTVRLPLTEKPPQPAQQPAAEHVPLRRARKVLVVDDNRDAAKALALLLRAEGQTVECAHDGREALNAMQTFRPDVMLLDIGLPEMDGYELARRIRQQHAEGILLIALSGYGQPEDLRRSQEAGFAHHLVKPVAYQDLMKLLAAE